MEDTQIIKLYNDRDQRAIAESDAKYGRYCFTVANNILDSREDSDECVNDTWLHTWNVIPPQCPDILKMFFARITRNLSLDRLKRRTAKRRGSGEFTSALDELEECVPDRSSVDDLVDSKRLSRCISDFLAQCPQRERSFFLRRYFFTEPVSNIAKRYKCSENTVSVTLHRVRAKLKAYLEKEGFTV